MLPKKTPPKIPKMPKLKITEEKHNSYQCGKESFVTLFYLQIKSFDKTIRKDVIIKSKFRAEIERLDDLMLNLYQEIRSRLSKHFREIVQRLCDLLKTSPTALDEITSLLKDYYFCISPYITKQELEVRKEYLAHKDPCKILDYSVKRSKDVIFLLTKVIKDTAILKNLLKKNSTEKLLKEKNFTEFENIKKMIENGLKSLLDLFYDNCYYWIQILIKKIRILKENKLLENEDVQKITKNFMIIRPDEIDNISFGQSCKRGRRSCRIVSKRSSRRSSRDLGSMTQNKENISKETNPLINMSARVARRRSWSKTSSREKLRPPNSNKREENILGELKSLNLSKVLFKKDNKENFVDIKDFGINKTKISQNSEDYLYYQDQIKILGKDSEEEQNYILTADPSEKMYESEKNPPKTPQRKN